MKRLQRKHSRWRRRIWSLPGGGGGNKARPHLDSPELGDPVVALILRERGKDVLHQRCDERTATGGGGPALQSSRVKNRSTGWGRAHRLKLLRGEDVKKLLPSIEGIGGGKKKRSRSVDGGGEKTHLKGVSDD